MKSIETKICKFIVTLGPVGSLPAPGTMGTLCALPLLLGVRHLRAMSGFLDEGVIVGILVFAVVWLIDKALVEFDNDDNDPSEIVIDEVIGFFVTMLFLPLNIVTVVLAFIYFRFFDIVKPFGIERLENIEGGWGIVLDDIAAAIYARIFLDITLYFIVAG